MSQHPHAESGASPPKLSLPGRSALAYAERFGWAVHPLKPRAKTPLSPHGFKDASKDSDQIRAWWTQHPEANIGIATGAISGISVLDEDVKNEAGGDATLTALLTEYGESLRSHVRQTTWSGGRQYFFAYDPRARQGAGSYGKGLDGRNDGGYVVAPPSVVNGKRYAWAVKPAEGGACLPMPAWLLDLGSTVAPTSSERRNPPGWADALMMAGVPEGQRDHEANRLIKHARETGKSEADCWARLTTFGSNCTPPFDPKTDQNIAMKIRKAYSKPPIFEQTPRPSIGISQNSTLPTEVVEPIDNPEGKPVIRTSGQADMDDVNQEAFAMIVRLNAEKPEVFQRGKDLVRVRADADQLLSIEAFTERSLRGYLATKILWIGTRRSSEVAIHPPSVVVNNILGRPSWNGIRALSVLTQAPVFSKQGTLITEPGYHPDARLWYAPHRTMEIVVPDQPSSTDIARARDLLLEDLLTDFPFDSEASRAHALCAILLLLAREMIDGPTPLHLNDATTPGSGKGLLVHLASIIVTGASAPMAALPRDENEIRKQITAQLAAGNQIIAFDNITQVLRSDALALALTTEFYTDRILGFTEMKRLPNRALWIATGNNVTMLTDMARRVVTCRLDAKMESPWERKTFKHDPILPWAHVHRSELVSAALTLIKAWIVAGRPIVAHPAMGGFEQWADTMAGILHVAGVPGFLENYQEAYLQADTDVQDWKALVQRWWDLKRNTVVHAKNLMELAREQGLLLEVLGADVDKQLNRFSRALGKMKGRVVGGFRIIQGKPGERGRPYSLEALPPPDQVVESAVPAVEATEDAPADGAVVAGALELKGEAYWRSKGAQ